MAAASQLSLYGDARTILDGGEPGFAEHNARIFAALEDGIEERVYTHVKPILDRTPRTPVTEGELQPVVNQLAAEALGPWRFEKPELATRIRKAFFRAAKEIVKDTGSATIGVCFIQASKDVMMSHFDDPNLRSDVPDFAIAIRDTLKKDKRASEEDVGEVRDVLASTLNDKTKLMDRDIHKNAVEIKYIKLYVGIRQAAQRVSEEWIAKRTKHLRDGVDSIESDQKWISRGINIAWSVCPGPEFAAPVVLIGTLMDVFMDADKAALKKEIARIEATLRSKFAELLSERLGEIAEVARHDLNRIDEGQLPTLSGRIFWSINEIEEAYANALSSELTRKGI